MFLTPEEWYTDHSTLLFMNITHNQMIMPKQTVTINHNLKAVKLLGTVETSILLKFQDDETFNSIFWEKKKCKLTIILHLITN